MTEARDIIAAAETALHRASAPICYLHRDGHSAAFAVVIETDHLHRLEALVPDYRAGDAQDLMMYHGHIEGDEDD